MRHGGGERERRGDAMVLPAIRRAGICAVSRWGAAGGGGSELGEIRFRRRWSDGALRRYGNPPIIRPISSVASPCFSATFPTVLDIICSLATRVTYEHLQVVSPSDRRHCCRR